MTDTAVNDTRNAARFAGILFLLQMTAAVISHSVILMPMLRGEHFLIDVAAHHTKVVIAMLLDLVTGAAVFGIAVILFPILKKHSERIALWCSLTSRPACNTSSTWKAPRWPWKTASSKWPAGCSTKFA